MGFFENIYIFTSTSEVIKNIPIEINLKEISTKRKLKVKIISEIEKTLEMFVLAILLKDNYLKTLFVW